MSLFLFKLKKTRKPDCDPKPYLYDGQAIVMDNLIKGLLLGEMVLGQVLQYYVKLLKK